MLVYFNKKDQPFQTGPSIYKKIVKLKRFSLPLSLLRLAIPCLR
jgi:hypothetical protein